MNEKKIGRAENMKEIEVKAAKDEVNELPIPTIWRPIFCEIVNAFIKGDYQLNSSIPAVEPVSNRVAIQIKDYIQAYGETLICLPEDTWSSSACIWMGNWWDVLIDLWTESEGPSDMVLSARVTESELGYKVSIQMLYVP